MKVDTREQAAKVIDALPDELKNNWPPNVSINFKSKKLLEEVVNANGAEPENYKKVNLTLGGVNIFIFR